MNYHTLTTKIAQNKLTKIFDEAGVFFAFNNEQMEKGLKKINAKIGDLTRIANGGYMPKKNVKAYISKSNAFYKWLKKEVKKLNPNEVICYELNNYECYYTGDTTSAYEALKSYGFTRDDVNKVYHNKNYILNK